MIMDTLQKQKILIFTAGKDASNLEKTLTDYDIKVVNSIENARSVLKEENYKFLLIYGFGEHTEFFAKEISKLYKYIRICEISARAGSEEDINKAHESGISRIYQESSIDTGSLKFAIDEYFKSQ